MGTAVTTGLGVIGQVSNYNEQMDSANAQRAAAMKQLNYTYATYEQERQDAFDNAVQQIAQVKQQANSAEASLAVSLGERNGSGGNTNKMLMRSAEGKESSAVSNIISNYKQKANEIDNNKWNSLVSTQTYQNSVKDPSALGAIAGIASTVAGAVSKGQTQQAQAKIDGVKFNWSDYWWKGSGTTGAYKKPT